MIIPFRLLAFCLLGVAMMLATGCAGKTGTVQPQGLNDAAPAADQTPAPSSQSVTPPDEPLDPFARAEEGAGEEYDPLEPMNTSIFEFNRQVDLRVLELWQQGRYREFLDMLPVDEIIEPGLEVFGPGVAIVDVIAVLPHIAAENW